MWYKSGSSGMKKYWFQCQIGYLYPASLSAFWKANCDPFKIPESPGREGLWRWLSCCQIHYPLVGLVFQFCYIENLANSSTKITKISQIYTKEKSQFFLLEKTTNISPPKKLLIPRSIHHTCSLRENGVAPVSVDQSTIHVGLWIGWL